MNKTINFTVMLILPILLLFLCSAPTSTTEYDYTAGLSENDLMVIKDILKSNGLENSFSNRKQIASVYEICSNDTVIYRLRQIRLHDKIFLLPQSVSELNDLEFIEITKTDNKLPLPDGLNYFKPVKGIIIYGRTIDSSFNHIINKLTPQHLVINDCRINNFPTHIFNDTSLNFLSLENDSINKISSEIGQLINLKTLFLNKNQLQELPGSISNIKQLKCMSISNNTFSAFPIVLTQLDTLKELNIAFNYISQLPNELLKLKNLIPGEIHFDGEVSFARHYYNFNISGNKICTVSSEIDSFLIKFAGDFWKSTQVCNE